MGLRTKIMQTQITCPSCKTAFNLEDVLSEDIEKNIREKYNAENQRIVELYQKKNEEFLREQERFQELKKRENELFQERLRKEVAEVTLKKESELRKKIEEEQQAKVKFLEEQQKVQEEKLRKLQQAEIQVLQLNKKLEEQQEAEAHNLRKLRLEVETELKETVAREIIQKEQERFDMERREHEKKLSDQNKLIEEMQRKMQQGSMQTQGEILELAIEEVLKQSFPFDVVQEVGKGKRGADCILQIRNESGQPCGRIIFESKRTKDFDKKWIPKLKEDMMEASCDLSILVSQVLPDEWKIFDQKDGVWICRFNELVPVVKLVREGLIRVARAQQSQENKGEKKEMLYRYFTSNEFFQQMQAINEAYLYLKSSLDREKLQMEKIWKEREKQIDKVLLNNSHLLGAIKGIAGADAEDIDLLGV